MNMKNVDMICAEHGSKIARIDKLSEPLVNKSLGVLQEEGVYAFFLFLAAQAKGEKNTPANDIQQVIFDLLKVFFQSIKDSQKDILSIIRNNLSEDLNNLFLARDIIERTLVYARYHLKAKPKTKEAQ